MGDRVRAPMGLPKAGVGVSGVGLEKIKSRTHFGETPAYSYSTSVKAREQTCPGERAPQSAQPAKDSLVLHSQRKGLAMGKLGFYLQ